MITNTGQILPFILEATGHRLFLSLFSADIHPSDCNCTFNMPNGEHQSLAPVHFFSHGSTAMLGEESKSADYWKACGDAALAHGIKHVIIMVRLANHRI